MLAYRLDLPDDIQEMIISDFAEKWCFACFTPDPHDFTIWDVYGDTGHGLCLGFGILSKNIRQVEYVPEMKVATIPVDLLRRWQKERQARPNRIRPTPLDKCIMRYFDPYVFTKLDKWKHEQELRAYCRKDEEEKGLYFANFKGNAMFLQEVILGLKCSITETEILDWFKMYPRQPIVIRRAEV